MNRLLVTRHAPYDIDPTTGLEFLTEQGLDVCRDKVTRLLALNIGHDAILLSSSSRRAVLTTHQVRQGLGIRETYKSRYITTVGTRPEPVRDLHDFTAKVLTACGVEAEGRDVLLIAHKPLVDAVSNQAADGIAEVPNEWSNPKFKPAFAFLAEDSEQSRRLWLR